MLGRHRSKEDIVLSFTQTDYLCSFLFRPQQSRPGLRIDLLHFSKSGLQHQIFVVDMFTIPKDGLLIVIMSDSLVVDSVLQEGHLAGVEQVAALVFRVQGHFNKIKAIVQGVKRYNRLDQQVRKKNSSMDQATLNFIYFLAVIGGIVFVVWISKLLWSIIKAILPSKNFPQRYGKRTWAVVTGGSDGIGLGFCEELAALGFNICMIARNASKMESAMAKIRQLNELHDVETKSITADFVNCQRDDFFSLIVNQLQGLDISILVNNVGISNIGNFHEIPEKRLRDQIYVNVMTMTLMTHWLVPKMLKREKRSAIVNLSSVAGEYPLPFISVYSATKAYNDFFSQSIEMEYSQKIDILSVKPLYVESNMSKMKKSCTVASKNQCAQASLKYLGLDYQTNGYYMHRFMAYCTSLMPTPLLRFVSEAQSRKVMEAQERGGEVE